MNLTVEYCVGDLQTGKRYVVVIRRADFRPICTPTVHGVARFTAKKYSPSEAGHILLRTPAFYRKQEAGDHMDGAQAADYAPIVAAHLRKSGISARENNLTAEGTIASSKEPWILCTSMRPTNAAPAKSLERQFSYKGTDAVVTTVDDQNAFARQLGIDFARSAGLKDAVKDDVIDVIDRHRYRLAFADEEIDAVVRVIHGPVHYQNATLTVGSGDDLANTEAHRVWFTKGTEFSPECEYRFAVSAGCPTTDAFRLDVSPELSRLTKSWRRGDRWWSS